MPYRRIGFSDRLSTSIRDVGGNLADPGTLTLKLKDPLGTVTTQTWAGGGVVRDGLGLFHYDLSGLTSLGPYRYKWNSTGANLGVSPNPRYFTLVDEWTPVLLTLDEVKTFVNATTPDADIELFLDSATETMEKKLGPIVPTLTTQPASYLPAEGKLLLPTHIVPGSITAATAGGSAVSVVGWMAGTFKSIILPTSTYLSGAVTVSYTAGFDPIPTPLKEAAALRVGAAYETQRGPATLPLSDDLGPSTGYPMLLRAGDKEADYVTPGIA